MGETKAARATINRGTTGQHWETLGPAGRTVLSYLQEHGDIPRDELVGALYGDDKGRASIPVLQRLRIRGLIVYVRRCALMTITDAGRKALEKRGPVAIPERPEPAPPALAEVIPDKPERDGRSTDIPDLVVMRGQCCGTCESWRPSRGRSECVGNRDPRAGRCATDYCLAWKGRGT